MKHKEVKKLIQSYLTGTCSDQERKLVESHFLGYLDTLTTAPTQQQVEESFVDTYAAVDADLRAIDADLSKKRRFRSLWVRYAAAAILVLGTFITWIILEQQKKSSDPKTILEQMVPGNDQAVLTLDNGKQFDLSSDQQGIRIEADAGQHITYSDGTLLIEDGDIGHQQTLATPRGGTYQVTLPDGTRVWLNAASKLSYPTRFDAKERIVTLEGEAYFAVTKQSEKASAGRKPFKVITAHQIVEVFGTEFNIKAYADEAAEKTTLIEGAVRVSLHQNGEMLSRNLIPGQQSLATQENIIVSEADVFSATAWKKGRFSFDGKSFSEIIYELGRWYNFKVAFEGPVPDAQLIGGAFHTDKISTVLRFLESGNIHYRLEKDEKGDNRLVIINNKEVIR